MLDYLAEEALHQQSARVQQFLLRTAILDRMCGSLCDAVLRDPSIAGRVALGAIEGANLFLVPLDGERRWYRYHQRFAEMLRQRLTQSLPRTSVSPPRSMVLHFAVGRSSALLSARVSVRSSSARSTE